MQAEVHPEAEASRRSKPHQGGLVRGTNMEAEDLREEEGSAADKAQSQVEGGCRLLKDPVGFVSSLLSKKPTRMQGLRRGMTGAWVVSAVAQRRLRQE
jgi:hypothetical protein